MAKKRKHHSKGIGKVRHHKRRRIGAIDSGGLMDDAITMTGLVVGQLASTAIQRKLTTMSPKLVGVVQIAAGVMIKRNVDHPFMKAIGWGIAGAGAMHVAHDAGVIHGIDGALDGIFDVPGNPFAHHAHHHGHCHPHHGHHHRPHWQEQAAAALHAAQSRGSDHADHPGRSRGSDHADQMHGLSNYDQMSMNGYEQMNGISNFDSLSVGATDPQSWMKEAYQNVSPLGM